jgi:hypothetical protein
MGGKKAGWYVATWAERKSGGMLQHGWKGRVVVCCNMGGKEEERIKENNTRKKQIKCYKNSHKQKL